MFIDQHFKFTVSYEVVYLVWILDIYQRPQVPGVTVVLSPGELKLSIRVLGTDGGLQLLGRFLDPFLGRPCPLLSHGCSW